jgi:hypothetical protein
MSPADMSGPLSGMSDGTTSNPKLVTNSFAPAGERQNKNPIFVSEVKDTHGFLTWIRVSCQSGLSGRNKGERLMLFPRIADGFRTTVSALRSLHGKNGESFHTFSLPEDRCVRLLNNWQTNVRGRSPGGVGDSGHLCPGRLAAPLQMP